MSNYQDSASTVSTVESELYFLIAKFLTTGRCVKTAEALKREIAEHNLLPKRFDWLGNSHQRDYYDLTRSNQHISNSHLLQICQIIGPILDKEVKPCVRGVQSLLGAGRQSLLRGSDELPKVILNLKKLIGRRYGIPLTPSVAQQHYPPNIALTIEARQLSGPRRTSHMIPCHFYTNYRVLCRTLGHLSSVYCILFDTSGRYIFTGADDNLVKIWSVDDGRLLSTLRGHSAEITDMAINIESTLLATGSCDKIIRIWCLKTLAPLAVLAGHTGMVTSLRFCPSSVSDHRYLISTGNDGCVMFWRYTNSTLKFYSHPIKFMERTRTGAQMICSSFSAGGVFLATGSADHHVRLYQINGNKPPLKMFEIEAHLDRVDSIQFAKNSYRFTSGSKDGTAKIWRYERQHWRSLTLQMSTKLKSMSAEEKENSYKLKVTMVGWSENDQFVITAVNTNVLKVWNSYSGHLVYELKGHEDEVFVIESHPTDSRVILSAGHDGKVCLWDLNNGSSIIIYDNVIEGQGHGAVFDCRFSPNGQLFASTDSHGHLSVYSMMPNERYKQLPEQQFFHTDYRPLIRDANHHVLDEQTQQAPHLMPPPFLVDIDGNPYPPHYQRLVPGRESCNNDQLIPYVAVSAGGESEILQPVRPNEEQGNQSSNQNSADQPDIDVMIGILEAQNRQNEPSSHSNDNENSAGPSSSIPETARQNNNNPVSGSSANMLRGMRRDGDIEGVRQSHGNWQSRDRKEVIGWTKRAVIKQMDATTLKQLISRIIDIGIDELSHYETESKRRPLPQPVQIQSNGRSTRRGRRRKIRKHGYNVRSQVNEVGEQNDTGTRQPDRLTSSGRICRNPPYSNEFENPEEIALSSSESTSGSGTVQEGTNVTEDTSSSSSSSSSSSETDSDWEQDAGFRRPKNERSVTRKQPKRGEGDNEIEDDEVDDDDDHDDDDDDDDDAADDIGVEEVKCKPKRTVSNRKARPRWTFMDLKKSIRSQLPGGLTELPEKFKPPEWLTDVIPKKTPYQPQKGDEIMYFPQGHKCYFTAVKKINAYNINIKHQPWTKFKLREQELVKLVAVKYEIKPPHLCCLKLELMDPATNDLTGEMITVKYHDMPDVIDFLVLRKYYETAINRHWKADDRFRSIIDDAWWNGTIESQEPFEDDYPDSMFQCFNVKWDNGEREKMSPWDLEPLDETRLPDEIGGSVAVLPQETAAILYQPSEADWPDCERNEACDRIARGLELIMSLSIAEPFNAPVDLNAYPLYAMVVEYPIDLSTIKSRLENRYYRRLEAISVDVKYIERDANQFNEPGTSIVKKARMITELCLHLIHDPSCEDVMSLYQEISESHHLKDHENGERDGSLSGSDNNSVNNPSGHYLRGRKHPHSHRPTKSILGKIPRKYNSRNSSRKPKKSWKQECIELTTNLLACEDSTPFRHPVDPFDYPDYRDLIHNPMDLTSVKRDLESDNYTDPTDFCKDVRLIFQNSKNYNTNKKSRIYSMTIRLSAIFEEHYKRILSNWESTVKYERRMKNITLINIRKKSSRTCRARRRRRKTSTSSQEPSTSKSVNFNDNETSSLEEELKLENGVKSENENSNSEELSESDDNSIHEEEEEKEVPKVKRAISAVKKTNGVAKGRKLNGLRKTSIVSPKKSLKQLKLSSDDENSSSNSKTEVRENIKDETKEASSSESLLDNSTKSETGRSHSNSSSLSSSESSDSSDLDDEKPLKNAKKTVEKNNQSSSRRVTRLNNKTDSIKNNKRRRVIDSDDDDDDNTVRPSSFSNQPKKRMTTRNRGKRTVQYHEDSEFEYGSRVSDSDNESRPRPLTTVSSRGRIRKLTSHGRAMIHD